MKNRCVDIEFEKWMKRFCSLYLFILLPFSVSAQNEVPDSIVQAIDSMYQAMAVDTVAISDSIESMKSVVVVETPKILKEERDWNSWRPDPQRALWLALVIPGGGQIYNRKYWKLPIVYGGFVGCVYAMMWNNMMYHDYSQAYLDIMDNDPTTASYNKFLHLGKQIDDSNKDRYKQVFKSRKDKYRRWRDLSFFCLVLMLMQSCRLLIFPKT